MSIYVGVSLIVVRLRNVWDRRCRKYTHFMFDENFFESLAVYEIVWENMVERDRLQVT